MTVKSKASRTSRLGPGGASTVTCSRSLLPSHIGDQHVCRLFVAEVLPFTVAVEQHMEPGVAQAAHGHQVPEVLMAEPAVAAVVEVVVGEPPLRFANDARRLGAGRLPVLDEPLPTTPVPGRR